MAARMYTGLRSRVTGDKGFRKILKQLPEAAREGMADVMRNIGADLVKAMKADAPYRTGALRAGISYRLAAKTLRLRIGLVGTPRGRAKLFYGRIIEFGRKAQTVSVHRLARGGRTQFLNRIRSGTARPSSKPSDLTTSYQLHVRARAKHPYVYKRRPELRRSLNTRLRNYWNNVLGEAAEGASFE